MSTDVAWRVQLIGWLVYWQFRASTHIYSHPSTVADSWKASFFGKSIAPYKYCLLHRVKTTLKSAEWLRRSTASILKPRRKRSSNIFHWEFFRKRYSCIWGGFMALTSVCVHCGGGCLSWTWEGTMLPVVQMMCSRKRWGGSLPPPVARWVIANSGISWEWNTTYTFAAER